MRTKSPEEYANIMSELFIDGPVCKPFKSEHEWYAQHNIPLWECEWRKEKSLGKIYEDENGSHVIAIVTPVPSIQCWKFLVQSAGDGEKVFYEIRTGSGCLHNYYDTMVKLAQSMIVIDKLKKY